MSGLRSADLVALRRQEQSGLFSDVQLGQKRELIPVAPLAYDLAIPHLGKRRPRHRHTSPGRGDGLSSHGSQPFGVGAARSPLDEDVITLGEDVEYLEVDVWKGRHEALVVAYSHGLVQWD